MKSFTIVAIAVCALGPVEAMAQTATGVGVGTGISSSRSTAAAVAVSGQGGGGGGGGNATSGPSTVNINSSVPPVQTVNTVASGTQTLKNVPTVFAPGLTAAGLETCLGSVSGGAGWLGTGVTLGGTIPDPGCNARLTARQLWSFGLHAAAVARLCLDADVYRSMPDICLKYLPQSQYAQPAAYPGPGPIFGVTPSAYQPAPYPNPAYQGNAQATDADVAQASSGGPILLVEGKTGLNRLCSDYDEPHAKCRKWAYSHDRAPKTKKTAPARTPAAVPAKLPQIIVDPPPASPDKAAAATDKAQ